MNQNNIPMTDLYNEIPPEIKKQEEIDEDVIRKISNYILNNYEFSNPLSYSSENILCGIIQFLKCNTQTAEQIFSEMENLGLSLHGFGDSGIYSFNKSYNFVKFAYMRGYITIQELGDIAAKHNPCVSDDEEYEEED